MLGYFERNKISVLWRWTLGYYRDCGRRCREEVFLENLLRGSRNQGGDLGVHQALRYLYHFLKNSTKLAKLWRAASCLFIPFSEGRKHCSDTSEVLKVEQDSWAKFISPKFRHLNQKPSCSWLQGRDKDTSRGNSGMLMFCHSSL